MKWFRGAWAVFKKDVRLEMRNRYAINMLLLFVVTSMLIVLFAIGQEPLSHNVQAALLWIVIIFATAIGLGRAFLSEEEGDTVLLLQLTTRPSMVYAGKLLFNFLLVLCVNVVALAVFWILLAIGPVHVGLLLATVFLGALGLSGATTLLAALIARAAQRGPMLPVLLFPLLAPLLLSVVEATRVGLEGGGWSVVTAELTTIVSFAGVTISASVLLFDYIWLD